MGAPKCTASEDFAEIGKGPVEFTPPTERQQYAARVIANVLGIPLPTEYSAKAYWVYIAQHMERSKDVSRAKRALYRMRRNSRPFDTVSWRKARFRAQREADWQAVHLNGAAWAQGVLDGRIMLPSWDNETLEEGQRRLRALGFKSHLEEELEALRDREFDRYMYL